MTSPIPAVYKSIVRATSDLIDKINEAKLYDENVSYHNWEDRGAEETLPSHTLIGVEGFSFETNEGRWVIRYSLAVSSYRDTNLLDEVELIGIIDETFGEGCKVNLLEMTEGDVVNELVVSAFRVMPMGQSELRNYRTIGIELLRTGT